MEITQRENDHRALINLGVAQSAITRCCTPLGETVCNSILAEIGNAAQRILDQA